MIKKTRLTGWLVVGMLASGAAQAALLDRGGGMIYDDVLNVTWLQDANHARTSGFDADGLMNWNAANAWAASLSYGGYSDWRLPTVEPVGANVNYIFSNNGTTDRGYGNTSPSSELAYMYYVNLGNQGFCTPNGSGSSTSCDIQPIWGLSNTGPFVNLEPFVYWSSTAFASGPADFAWLFFTRDGYQYIGVQRNEFYAWAVRSGDVAAVQDVPEPAGMTLVALALSGFAALRRRRPLDPF